MELVRFGCQNNIRLFEEFIWQDNIDLTIRLYIFVLKQGYDNEFNNAHAEFTINQFEKMLSVNPNYNIHAKDDRGNTYLHEVCETTWWWGHPFCVELFDYFLSKGLNPEDKNNEGQTCLDIINKEHLKEAKKCIYKSKMYLS